MTSDAVDAVARKMIEMHEKTCDERMGHIDAQLAAGNSSRQSIHNRLNALILFVMLTAVAAFAWQYQQNEVAKNDRLRVIETIQQSKGG